MTAETTFAPVDVNLLAGAVDDLKPSVLMLAALYRPSQGAAGAAGVRAHAMATGLRAAGHAVTVICARSADNERRVEAGVEVIPAPWADVEAHARRIGVELRDLPRPHSRGGTPRNTALREIVARTTIPDRYVIWIPGAVAAARRQGREHDMVISTGPVSAHLAARAVLGGRPWVADINDFWALNPHRTNRRMRDAIDVFLERRTLGAATQLTTVNDVMRDELHRRTGKPVTTVYSGFDPNEFDAVRHERAAGAPVRLLYAGTLYPSQNLEPLFRVLAALRRERGLSSEEIQVSFIGRVTDRAVLEAERSGVGDLVAATDPIPRHDLLARMCATDALILPLYDSDRSALPMKIFEYIGAERPILAWGERDSLAARAILDNRFGVVAASEQELDDYVRRLLSGGDALPSGDDQARAQFTWRRGVETLTELVAVR
jgi:glycosyltransferase involved in cell wall biosynthesis